MIFTRLSARRERPVQFVPKTVVVLLVTGLCAQIFWHQWRPEIEASASGLPVPPSQQVLYSFSLGEPETLSKLLMLWLQAFDHQPGISIPFKNLNYDRVILWLDRILSLDERSQYPLLSAVRLYAEVPDNDRRRKMLDFVYREFLKDPDKRWRWMADAVMNAKYKLGDMELAGEYARALRIHATSEDVPDIFKQMELFILEDLGDIEGARVLLGALIDSGVITDPNEMRFFLERLDKQVESEK